MLVNVLNHLYGVNQILNRGKLKMPRTQRLIINDETAVYHAWGVELITSI